MSVSVVGFDWLKDEYAMCSDFGIIFQEVSDGKRHAYEDYFFKRRLSFSWD